MYTDQKKTIYKVLCCKSGAKYSMSMKTLQTAKQAYSNGFRQGPTEGDMLYVF